MAHSNSHHLSWKVFHQGEIDLDTARTIKADARFSMGQIDPSAGEIPDWNQNPEAYEAYKEIATAARELEKAYIKLLAVYERQELNDSRDTWAYADSRRSA